MNYSNTISYHQVESINSSFIVDLNETNFNENTKYLIQNWQFEIRKLTYDDAGTYTCLLPLVKPITKNITLQIIRKLYF